MSQPSPADHPSPGANPATAPVIESGFATAVQAFWEKNRNLILLVCAATLLAIAAREGWQYFSALREQGVQEEYTRIADKSDKLAAFAEANSGHVLAGVAYLRLADETFAAADYKQAGGIYQKAVGLLKNEALLGRARLGQAMSQLSAGDKAAGEAALKALGADQTMPKSVRAEATYHLASLAAEAGNSSEMKKLVEEVGKIDPNGGWSQRATMLLATLEVSGKPADAPLGLRSP